jgi:arylsulfatase A-like enzyme
MKIMKPSLSLARYVPLAILPLAAGCRQEKPLPNIIFLLTDDQRFDAMGYTGNPYIKTPNIDRLAEHGIIFENAYVTTSISCASRASILTGQYASRHGINDFNTDFSDEALFKSYPLILKTSAGYKTGFIGKYGVGLNNHPVDKYDYWGCEKVVQPRYENYDSTGKMTHYTDLVNSRIQEFLSEYGSAGPFCLSVSFKAPHVEDSDPRQFIYNERYSGYYKDLDYPRPESGDDKYWKLFPEEFRKDNEARRRWQIRFETDSLYRESVRGYYRLIQGVDDVVGNLTGTLEELGIDDNTIIIMMGDNGFFLGEHGLAGKWFAYNESVRIPLFIYNPREKETNKGKRIRDIVLNIDIAPTILEFAGLDKDTVMQGEALQKTWQEGKPEWRDKFFYEHRFVHPGLPKSEALISLDYKYINYYELPDSSREFYDLRNDPEEIKNLINSSEYNDRIKKYESILDSIRLTVK